MKGAAEAAGAATRVAEAGGVVGRSGEDGQLAFSLAGGARAAASTDRHDRRCHQPPQAKGRIENLFGTLQDRLVKEMRLAQVSRIEAANRFLAEVFIPFWEGRFTVEPRCSRDAHRRLEASTGWRRFSVCERLAM